MNARISRIASRTALAAIAAGTILAASQAGATTLLYNDFSSTAGLQLNGVTAAINTGGSGTTDFNNDQVLRLTNSTSQSGSAFSTTQISLDADASFSTVFNFRFTDQQNTGADGIVFVVQTVSNLAGGSGGGIGYAGLGTSIGIEFDNWLNGGSDPNDNHVGINVNGSVNSVATSTGIPVLDNGDVFTAWVDYDGSTDTLEVRANTTGTRPAAALLTYNVDLVTVLGQTDAYVGFTSGTGLAGADHDILSWQFNSTFDPIDEVGDVIEPAALAIAGLGLIGLGAAARRRR